MTVEDIVVDLIALNGGELVGRTRLQKQAYLLHRCLLHRCGAGLDLPFVYHHYGPYSSGLVDGLTEARAEERIEVEERLGRHGVPYAIFRLKKEIAPPERIGRLDAAKVRELLAKMKKVSDIVLELAATIVFLREEGGYPDRAAEETKARKPLKATKDRMARAHALLDALGLGGKATLA